MSFEDDFRDETGLTPWEKLDLARDFAESGELDNLASLFPSASNSEDKILHILKQILEKFDNQQKLLTKVAVSISQLHDQGQINEETFNKLDAFLKPYYDESNLTKDY